MHHSKSKTDNIKWGGEYSASFLEIFLSKIVKLCIAIIINIYFIGGVGEGTSASARSISHQTFPQLQSHEVQSF